MKETISKKSEKQELEIMDLLNQMVPNTEIIHGKNNFVFNGYDNKNRAVLIEPEHNTRHAFDKETFITLLKNSQSVTFPDSTNTDKTIKETDTKLLQKTVRQTRKMELSKKLRNSIDDLIKEETDKLKQRIKIKGKEGDERMIEFLTNKQKLLENDPVEYFNKELSKAESELKGTIKQIRVKELGEAIAGLKYIYSKENKKEVTGLKEETKKSWTEKILKKVEEKRKKILETFTKKSGHYGKLVLQGATALVASVGILHGQLTQENTNIFTNQKIEEPAPKQETAEEMLRKIEEQFTENKIQAEEIREEYKEREKFAQDAFRKGAEPIKERFENPVSEKIEQKEESSVETPEFETVSPLEINPEKDLELRKQAEEENATVIKDYLKNLENGQTVINEINEKEEGTQELSAPTPEQVYDTESTPTKVKVDVPLESEQFSSKEQKEIKLIPVEYQPLTPETIKNVENLISYVCENEHDKELRWGQLKGLKADEVIKHKGISSVDPAFERLAKCLREFKKKKGEPKRNLLGIRETVESYVNRMLIK